MFAKSLLAATAIAATAVAAGPAQAKTNWDIHIGLGAPVYPVYEEPVYVYEPVVPVYRYHPPRYRVVEEPTYSYGFTYRHEGSNRCDRGARSLRAAGFRSVDAYDCSGSTFGYTAYRGGDLFKVRVNRGGDIVSVRQID